MRTIHTEIGILAPAAHVWDILIDTNRWAEWNPFAKASGTFAVGERVTVTLTPPGKSAMTIRPTVVRLEPGQELKWLGHLGIKGLFDGEHRPQECRVAHQVAGEVVTGPEEVGHAGWPG